MLNARYDERVNVVDGVNTTLIHVRQFIRDDVGQTVCGAGQVSIEKVRPKMPPQGDLNTREKIVVDLRHKKI